MLITGVGRLTRGAPAGSELNDDIAPSQAWDAFDEFDL